MNIMDMTMSKYIVPMCRDTSQHVLITVEADNPEEAEQRAYEEARNNWELPWEDSDFTDKPYCSDLAEITEIF